MKKIVLLKDFKNKKDYKRFYNSAFPFNDVTKRFDISKLIKNKKSHKLNAMICYCLQNAGQKNEFFHYELNDENSLIYYENVCTNFVQYGKDDEIYYLGVPHISTFEEYEKKYNEISKLCYNECRSNDVKNEASLCSSAIIGTELISAISGSTSDFLRPFAVWGKYEKKLFKYYLNISMRFHHSIFVGRDMVDFLNKLDEEFKHFKV